MTRNCTSMKTRSHTLFCRPHTTMFQWNLIESSQKRSDNSMREKKTVAMYGGAISSEQKKISKLLNAYARLRRWHRVYERSENIKESGPSGQGVERKKRERLGKARAYYRMHIYRHVHFRALDPRERRLFASRHLLAKPAGLFTYLLPCSPCVPVSSSSRGISPPLSSYFLSFLFPLPLPLLSFFVFSSSFPDSSLPRASTIRRKVFTLHRDPVVASVKISEFHRNGKREREKSMRRDESSVVFRISFKWRFFRILVVEQDDGILCENVLEYLVRDDVSLYTIILYLSLIEDALISVYHLSIIYGWFLFLIRCTILMADHKTEGILSSEILDGFIKVKKRKLFLFSVLFMIVVTLFLLEKFLR